MSNTRYRSTPYDSTFYRLGRRIRHYNPMRFISETRVKPKFNEVSHFKTSPIFGKIWKSYENSTSYWDGYVPPFSVFTDCLNKARSLTDQPVAIPWHRLPTSSDFNALGFLAELDDTIAMFSFKTARSLLKDPLGSYGLYTWGILPLVSDLESILAIILAYDSFRSVSDFHAVSDQTFSLTNKLSSGVYWTFEGTAKLTFAGKIYSGTGLPVLADYIGIKPDLATMYDLAPLSFVLDYFLPIGDFLDDVVRSGWTSSTHFQGSYSEKVLAERFGASGHVMHTPNGGMTSYYKRSYVDTAMPVNKVNKPLRFELPSFKEIFNTAYILALPGIKRAASKKLKEMSRNEISARRDRYNSLRLRR